MDHQQAQDWLDGYLAAWRSHDPALIGDLFSDDVRHRYHPYDAPVVGRVTSWPPAPRTTATGRVTEYYLQRP